VLALACALPAGAAATPSECATPLVQTADGLTLKGSPCADRLVASSPLVERIVGGEGDDVIYANPEVVEVVGGAGDDVIHGELLETEVGIETAPEAAPPASAPGPIYETDSPRERGARRDREGKRTWATLSAVIYGGAGSQTLRGGSGSDRIFGQRGNDRLYGEAGNDALYGGVGDDFVYGNEYDDLVSGGLGADTVDGNSGSDLLRGDGTIDTIRDTGALGTDTLSFATAVAPGFTGPVPYEGFPAEGNGQERGIYLRLDGGDACAGLQACNNMARYGGGNDAIEAGGFENVIGSAFSDLIIGSEGANRIDGGGGADAILGQGGNDTLYGGADGDYLEGGTGTDAAFGQAGENSCAADAETRSGCAGETASLRERNRGRISVGFAVSGPSPSRWSQLYLVGSEGADHVSATASGGHVVFTTHGSTLFNTATEARTEFCIYEATRVDCSLQAPLDAVVLAGMGGNDELAIYQGGFAETATPVLLGGEGSDLLWGSGSTEDMLVDGPGTGNDSLFAYGYDDALINNEGLDSLQGGNGNDLLLSATTCEGDTLQGAESGKGDGAAVNNSSWAQLPATAGGVVVDLAAGAAGNAYSAGPACASGALGSTRNIDDLEGSSQDDVLFGDGADNNLLGRLGSDGLWGRAGADNIEAFDGIVDSIGGGEGADSCAYDSGIDTVNGCNP
jgi:Ca2+-binding RTX toxin-like protein